MLAAIEQSISKQAYRMEVALPRYPLLCCRRRCVTAAGDSISSNGTSLHERPASGAVQPRATMAAAGKMTGDAVDT